MRISSTILLGLVLAGGCRRAAETPTDRPSPQLGLLCPPITADGWLNGPPPETGDQQGHIVVIDCWAHWCAPCRASAPRLVKLQDQFSGEDVTFVGLTAEGLQDLNEIKAHLAHLKIPWPNGYGARKTMRALGVNSLPTRLIVGRNNHIIWRGEDVGQLGKALQRAVRSPVADVTSPPRSPADNSKP